MRSAGCRHKRQASAAANGRKRARERQRKSLAVVAVEERADIGSAATAADRHRDDADLLMPGDIQARPERIETMFADLARGRELAHRNVRPANADLFAAEPRAIVQPEGA